MPHNAFLLVNVRPDAVSHPSEELKQIPGVSRVEEVSGIYDFLVEIETSAYFALVSDILMAKPWVKRVHVLRPIRTDDTHIQNSNFVESISDKNMKPAENNQKSTQSWQNPAL